MTRNRDAKLEGKLTFCLKNDMRTLVTFKASSGNLKICTLTCYFYRKSVMLELKKYR